MYSSLHFLRGEHHLSLINVHVMHFESMMITSKVRRRYNKRVTTSEAHKIGNKRERSVKTALTCNQDNKNITKNQEMVVLGESLWPCYRLLFDWGRFPVTRVIRCILYSNIFFGQVGKNVSPRPQYQKKNDTKLTYISCFKCSTIDQTQQRVIHTQQYTSCVLLMYKVNNFIQTQNV